MIRSRYNKIKDLISDNLFYIVNLNFLKKDLSKLKNIKKNIFKIRNKVWG